ncbi:MAG: diguanylate cyclase [Pseudomonadota bacterium]
MTPTEALLCALARKHLAELLPTAILPDLPAVLDEADTILNQHAHLKHWLERVERVDVWQEILKPPVIIPAVLDAFQQALFENRCATIRYHDVTGDSKSGLIHPLGLIKRNGVLYAVASFRDYADAVLLALHRIDQVTITEDPVRLPAHFSGLDEYLSQGRLNFTKGQTLDIEIEFRDRVRPYLDERPLIGQEIVISPSEAGYFRVTGTVVDSWALRWWLLGFNDEVRIHKPETLSKSLQGLRFDYLTGLINRHEFVHVLERRLAEVNREKQPIALLLLDLDHFKQINDRHGHLAGDHTLRQTAEVVKQQLRQMDTAARYGGEEFIVILPNTGQAQAIMIAERVRVAVAQSSQPPHPPVTVSIGVAEYAGQHAEVAIHDLVDRLIRAADQALYQAKANGRDGVHLFTGNLLD